MRDIRLSPEVFGALWAARQGNEASEDDILRRVLKVPTKKAPKASKSSKPGWTDDRFGVSVPEGFTISRRVKKLPRQARAVGGRWELLPVPGLFGQAKPGGIFTSLNELSQAAGAGIENAWKGWFYIDDATRERRPISDLRDPARITPRR